MGELVTQDGEDFEGVGMAAPSSMAVQLHTAEIDQQITTARAYPRSLKRVQSAIMSMATLDEESAEECIYALPRGGKPIRGPSIRFAEILKQSYGNCRAGARVVHVDPVEMYVEAEGVFHDLETNSQSTARVRRRISDKKGKIFNGDMIIVTGNAACSIAMRNAILAGVPKPLWRRAYDTVQATITGDVTTLTENRERAFKALAAFGVKPEQVFQALGVEGVEDISVDHIATLRGMYSALKNGEATVEEMFVGTVKMISDHQKIADPLSDEPAASQAATTAQPDSRQETTDQEPVDVSSVDGGSGTADPSTSPAAPPSDTGNGVDEEAGDMGAREEPVASPASVSLSADDKAFLVRVFQTLKAAVGPDVNVLKRQALIFTDEIGGKSDLVRAKAKTIRERLQDCCGDDPKSGTVAEAKYLAGIIGVDDRELAG